MSMACSYYHCQPALPHSDLISASLCWNKTSPSSSFSDHFPRAPCVLSPGDVGGKRRNVKNLGHVMQDTQPFGCPSSTHAEGLAARSQPTAYSSAQSCAQATTAPQAYMSLGPFQWLHGLPPVVLGLVCPHPSPFTLLVTTSLLARQEPTPVSARAQELSGEPRLPGQPSYFTSHGQTVSSSLLTAPASPRWPHRPGAWTEDYLSGQLL